MSLSSIIEFIKRSNLTHDLLERTKRDDILIIQGGTRSSNSLVVSSIAKANNSPLFVIAPTIDEGNRWFNLLQTMGWSTTHLYPTSEVLPYDKNGLTNEIAWGQLQVISELINSNINNNDLAIVSTERSLQPHLPPPSILKSICIELTKGKEIELDLLSELLTSLGYERTTTTESEGNWSRRGDIIDIYPVSSELPLRLEFFGNEIEKIKEFDPTTQRSLDNINSVCITPTGIAPIIASELRRNLPNYLDKLMNEEDFDALISGSTPNGINRYTNLIWKNPCSLIEYIPKNSIIVIDDKHRGQKLAGQWVNHAIQNYNENLDKLKLEKSKAKTIWPPTMHKTIDEVNIQLSDFKVIELNELRNISDKTPNSFDLSTRDTNIIANNFSKISKEMKTYQAKRIRTWILSAQPSRAVALLHEHDIYAKFIPNTKDHQSIELIGKEFTPIALKSNSNSDLEGFFIPAFNTLLITDKEFFGQATLGITGYIRRRRKSISKSLNPNKIQSGDFVVHRHHGIGKFNKIEKLSFNGKSRDYLVVDYQDGKLSVAADQLGSLGRYRTNSDKPPKINKLGGKAWESLKIRTKKFIKKLAFDLTNLYAERSQIKGFSFPSDGPWQNELEDSFPYDPTPDQKKAVNDVKKDMEKSVPMDRLICGDVGFGKTEVAIRALFKAITAGKQGALLAPTTVLTQQHWRTISDRFAPYPIKVALLNRFKSSSERKQIIDDIKNGTIDLVVGTHQILGKNIKFANLGLLVVDEEQRFGVTQKEKIKSIKKNIDVITLTATPIPRTLYMSLSGVREMSIIATPPPLRRAIKTHMSRYDIEVVRSAICQEIDRGGQIFYVVPRVEGIENVAKTIRELIPKISLLIAHGQMSEGELETSMIAFNSGEADLMICTTIIESGLDIPRVNTILIEDAHKFGLSQLYQLRGRVGRSGIQAHAWLFYNEYTELTDNARDRLKAMQEFAELGSGYQLAMRDMEIRGVGNILGLEQSGQMEAIGFDLYMEMLRESLADLQGQDIPKVDEAQIDLQVTAFIPGDWIANTEEKLAAYRAATQCKTNEELADLVFSWIDRYGKLPEAVETLVDIMKLKLLSQKCGFYRIKKDNNNIILYTNMEETVFRRIRKGLPEHLHSRFIYQESNTKESTVLVRGIGVLSSDKQIHQLIDWLNIMGDQTPENAK